MLRILSLIVAVIVVSASIIFALGYSSNPKYSNSVTFYSNYSVHPTWQEIINIKEITNRKADVESIEVLEEFGILSAWQENLKNGGYRIYRMNKRIENRLLEIELTDSSYGLTGIWTFELRPIENDTEVTIYEESTLTDLKRRGYRTIIGREHDLLVWQKYIKVGLVQALLKTP